MITYHCAAVVHVVLIFVGVRAEVNHSSDAGERPTRLGTKTALQGFILKLSLARGNQEHV